MILNIYNTHEGVKIFFTPGLSKKPPNPQRGHYLGI